MNTEFISLGHQIKQILINYGLIFSCLLVVFSLSAQLPNQSLKDYQTAKSQVVVLQNPANLLPLQKLDTLRPVFKNIGLTNDAVLLETLNAYQPFSTTHYDDYYLPINKPAVPDYQGRPNLAIIAVHTDLFLPKAPYFPALLELENDKQHTVLVLFGSGEMMDDLADQRFANTTIVWAENDDPWTQSIIAQIIFGGMPATATLTEKLNAKHLVDTGEKTESLHRLSYAPAAAVGMDAAVLEDSIRAIIEEGRVYGAFPGAQVLVARNGTVVYHETFGYHSSQILQPVQKNDLYDLASVTKITSALPALMKAYGEGRFILDAPLSKYYPAFRRSNKADLTFRNMLAHQARLRPWIPYWQGTLKGNGRYPWSKRRDNERINDFRFRPRTFAADSTNKYSIYVAPELWLHRNYQDKMMRAIRKSSLNEESGYRYSGLLFYLLPQIITDMENEDYEIYLKNTFYQPLGAYSITYNPTRFFELRNIIPTERDSFFRMTDLHGFVHDEGAAMMGGVSANAGLFATTTDLAKLMQMYLNGGFFGGEQLIKTPALYEFTRCQYCEEGNRRGLGFDKPLIEYDALKSSVAEAASANSFGHSGYTGTFTWADPDSGLLYVFMSNRVYPTRANRGIYIRNIRPRIHTAIYKALEEK